jgi:hypothetical protein
MIFIFVLENMFGVFFSVLSYSVFEADDEHEVVLSTTRTGVNGTREKSHIETFNCLCINFIVREISSKFILFFIIFKGIIITWKNSSLWYTRWFYS